MFFETTLSVLAHQLSVSFWFFLLRTGRLLLPVRGFRGLVLTGILGLLFWHRVKLCIVHGHFPADSQPRSRNINTMNVPIVLTSLKIEYVPLCD